MWEILDFGAKGDGETNDASAIQQAIDRCAESGGGRVVVGGGRTYLTGQINLKSHVDLHIEGGAILLASKDPQDYPDKAFLRAFEAENVAVTGIGEINGRGVEFMREDHRYIYWLRRAPDSEPDFRPQMISFIGCRNVTFHDLTIRDTPAWGLHLIGCEDILIQGVRILNNLKVPNCDGIDPDHCRNVRINNCHIEAGDDCIVVKNSRPYRHYGITENIIVTGCTLVSTSAALKIGTEGVNDFRNIIFDSCIIDRSNRGMAIQVRDEGNVENVLFSNIVVNTRLFYDDWWGKAEPIYVTSLPRSPETVPGKVRHVRFSNIFCRGENGVFIQGTPENPIEDVVLETVRLEIEKTTKWMGGLHDIRPPEIKENVYHHPTVGVFAKNARSLKLRNVSVIWGANRPDYFGSALELHMVKNLETENFTGESAHPDRFPAVVKR